MRFSLFSLLWIAPFVTAAYINPTSNVKATNNTESTSVTQHLYSHDASFHPDFYLSVTYENLNIACEQRMSVLINGTSPGPELRLPPGKTSWIRVCNDMDDHNTTMHWHGLSQNTATFSDGSAVSQWPIAPHRCFDYEVHPEMDSAGTYFYHSHIGFQAVTATGPLIVEDAGAPPYKYDDERVLCFTDYFHKTDHEIEEGLTSPRFRWSGEANAILLNGVGISDTVKEGRNECSLPILDVEPDKTYRLRFIGALALSLVSFGIENHTDMNVIGADGHYTKPHQVDYMQVTSGQRFDVLLKTKSAEEVAEMPTWYMQFETKDRPSISTNFGILRYPGSATTTNSRKARDSGGKNSPSNSNNGYSNGHSYGHSGDPNKSGHGKDIPSNKPIKLTNNTAAFLEYALEPLTPNDFPSASEVTRRIHITNQQLMNSTLVWQMDGLSWTEYAPENSPPYLVDIYRNGPSAMPDYAAALANGGWDPKTLTWPVKLGEVLEIILENTGSDNPRNRGQVDFHPFHIHGGHYYDCGSGAGVYNAAENEKKLAGYNPVLRDTTNLYRYADETSAGKTDGWRVWRLRVQDAGVWMLHCHILQHMIMGMQSVWVMGDWEQIARIPYSGAKGYLEFDGTAYGGDDISPVVWQEFD